MGSLDAVQTAGLRKLHSVLKAVLLTIICLKKLSPLQVEMYLLLEVPDFVHSTDEWKEGNED